MERINLIRNQLVSGKGTKSGWVLKFTELFEFTEKGNLKGKTLFITGASRGIGLSIALRAAKDGANIAIVAKTTTPQKNLPGTIYTAAEEITKAGGKALAIACDIRDEESVKKAVQLTVETFGGIDILVNNASAVNLSNTEDLDMKRYDLMMNINTRGTFLCSKYCLPYLKKSTNGHILNLSPPLNMDPKWFKNHVAYTMAKYGMSLCVLGMAEEFKPHKIGVNALWPNTSISTAAVINLLGGEGLARVSRTTEIVADAAYIILTSDAACTTGNFFIDEEVLAAAGINDLKKYNVDKNLNQWELAPDFFV
jgi:citronellol/citronellal dehydrogenase